MNRRSNVLFEDALSDDWTSDPELVEVPLDHKSIWAVGVFVIFVATAMFARIVYLNVVQGDNYLLRAEANATLRESTVAPRGMIYDRNGLILAKNKPSFSAILNIGMFRADPEIAIEVLHAAEKYLGMSEEDVLSKIENATNNETSVILKSELSQETMIALRAKNIKALNATSGFNREYIKPSVFSALLGYVGLPSVGDMEDNPKLTSHDMVGKAGIEAFYDSELQGIPGREAYSRDARGNIIGTADLSESKIGAPLTLSIDAEFQEYFSDRMSASLRSIGRTSGVGLAMDPRTGEILAFLNFPTFDNNILSTSGNAQEKVEILNNKDKPLFIRAISGLYNPGSTVKPLVGVAALAEGVIDPVKSIFSPGYLDVPNPFNPSRPTRFLDWRYQGDVNLASAIAQSSNVYFYIVGGGREGEAGLGIERLRKWWQKFSFGERTGIDLPGEAKGFLPSIEWKEEQNGRPWLLGDTYNVSIGQGDLLITPIQLISYISAIANGGTIYRPTLNINSFEPEVISDLTEYRDEIREVQKGMRKAVTSSVGTARLLNDISVPVAGKTGTAQTNNNTLENAFFVGYLPYNEAGEPELAVLILVERAKQGSLNAVPIARDVMAWYAENRL